MKEWRPDKRIWGRLKDGAFGAIAMHTFHEDYLYEAGANAMLKALKPLILEIAPGSKLIDVLYKKD